MNREVHLGRSVFLLLFYFRMKALRGSAVAALINTLTMGLAMMQGIEEFNRDILSGIRPEVLIQ